MQDPCNILIFYSGIEEVKFLTLPNGLERMICTKSVIRTGVSYLAAEAAFKKQFPDSGVDFMKSMSDNVPVSETERNSLPVLKGDLTTLALVNPIITKETFTKVQGYERIQSDIES